jgi:hypothetical protein
VIDDGGRLAAALAVPSTQVPATSKGAEQKAPVPAKPARKAVAPVGRKPAFIAAHAPKEPLREMPLPERAKEATRW